MCSTFPLTGSEQRTAQLSKVAGIFLHNTCIPVQGIWLKHMSFWCFHKVHRVAECSKQSAGWFLLKDHHSSMSDTDIPEWLLKMSPITLQSSFETIQPKNRCSIDSGSLQKRQEALFTDCLFYRLSLVNSLLLAISQRKIWMRRGTLIFQIDIL